MQNLNLKKDVVKLFQPFYDQVIDRFSDHIHSITIIGSALTEDFDASRSDVNSVVILKKMDLSFLEHFAPLGKTFGKKRIAAPLIMTPEYIATSLDVFPIEFLNIQLIHQTVFGDDIFEPININKKDLRYQCERELKVKLIDLRQRYIASLGSGKILAQSFIDSFSGYTPLFRAIICLFGQQPPIGNAEVISKLGEVSGVPMEPFRTVLKGKNEILKRSIEELNAVFTSYYTATEKLGNLVDEINI